MFRAYYFAFSETGCQEVDEILNAVARAGKAHHHTECWGDSENGEPSYAEQIQRAAGAAAKAFETLRRSATETKDGQS